MPYCPKCGEKALPNVSFCTNCGEPVEGTSKNNIEKPFDNKTNGMNKSTKKWMVLIICFLGMCILLILIKNITDNVKAETAEEIKEKAVLISYYDLIENSDVYKGQTIKHQGVVIKEGALVDRGRDSKHEDQETKDSVALLVSTKRFVRIYSGDVFLVMCPKEIIPKDALGYLKGNSINFYGIYNCSRACKINSDKVVMTPVVDAQLIEINHTISGQEPVYSGYK